MIWLALTALLAFAAGYGAAIWFTAASEDMRRGHEFSKREREWLDS